MHHKKMSIESKIAEENGIQIPRIRSYGYKLMYFASPYTEEDVLADIEYMKRCLYDTVVHASPRLCVNSNVGEYSEKTDRIEKKYIATKMVTNPDGSTVVAFDRFRWELLHGKRRKDLKFEIKKSARAVRKHMETHNKYCGRKDVLSIYARIGGNNWGLFGGGKIERQPWFLEKVDNYFDETYCSIYAKVKVSEEDFKELEKEYDRLDTSGNCCC